MPEQEGPPLGLMRGAGLIEFGEVGDLADVVEDDASAHERSVHGHAETLELLQEDLRGFPDEIDMAEQTRRCSERRQQGACFGRGGRGHGGTMTRP